MAVYVNTNYSALQGQRYLGNVQSSLTTTYQRLSSGMRINSAKDDAAGLQIADRLTSQINGLNQGNRNAADGIALAQTIEAGMDEVSGMLQKMRTLSVQANNGTNTAEDRKSIGKEIEALAQEVNRIAKQTTFAGKTVLNGASKTDNSSIFGNDATKGADATDKGAGSEGTMTLQVGSNKGDTISFKMTSVMFSAIVDNKDLMDATGDKIFKIENGKLTVALSKAKTDDSAGSIGALITHLDAMIGTVDGKRADLGAIQNRLESSIRNQSNVAANEADARSRIRDADFAEESANLSQQSIIQQAAASMLMQANTRPQLGLSLLG
ncbi:MAG: flagellin [Anaerobiospirillum succiniciproducens]|uniref:flagellin N-terminal helical domain-containing protein n=1 Tax=Anaerobiospirillum succiniciproducens TaxID=13335 RepID=UPI0026DC95F4|nr:flagellin [Anaerobiospirillum succiniciproducens]MDO4675358.1 flagellin [Anaerobiospirillum succiniciproducens]